MNVFRFWTDIGITRCHFEEFRCETRMNWREMYNDIDNDTSHFIFLRRSLRAATRFRSQRLADRYRHGCDPVWPKRCQIKTKQTTTTTTTKTQRAFLWACIADLNRTDIQTLADVSSSTTTFRLMRDEIFKFRLFFLFFSAILYRKLIFIVIQQWWVLDALKIVCVCGRSGKCF